MTHFMISNVILSLSHLTKKLPYQVSFMQALYPRFHIHHLQCPPPNENVKVNLGQVGPNVKKEYSALATIPGFRDPCFWQVAKLMKSAKCWRLWLLMVGLSVSDCVSCVGCICSSSDLRLGATLKPATSIPRRLGTLGAVDNPAALCTQSE